MLAARNRRNRRAVRIGYVLFAVSLLVLVSGLLLMRIGGFDLEAASDPQRRVLAARGCPAGRAWLYWLHRLAGPRIKWRVGTAAIGLAVAALVLGMVWLHSQDPRGWYAVGPESGAQYFEPSLARTATGQLHPGSRA